MRARPTARGWGLLASGVVLVQIGLGLGAVDLVRIGLLPLVVVVASFVVVSLRDPSRSRHRLSVTREVVPNPVHAHEQLHVAVRIRALDRSARTRLSGLRFSEQAAAELSGGQGLRARVTRELDNVTVSYGVQAARRGRWPVGPLVVTHGDVFGTVRTTALLGEQAEVAVWPTVVPLPAPNDVLVGEPDRVALGARSPSTDDAALRDYREGDDLRRVHWRSSARRGDLVVRSDERAGMRPVSVLMDLPMRGASLEWTISLAASMALAMLEAGHPVRWLGSSTTRAAATVSAPGLSFVHARSDSARARLLDETIDLQAAGSSHEAEEQLVDATHLLENTEAGGEIVLAVLGPLGARAQQALAHVADTAQGWAMVRTDGTSPQAARDAEATIRALRRAGWRACGVTPGEDVLRCWLRLLGSAR
jgi:uncharacterized protein (DUF58 family)